jgi:hypothetical protein
MASQVDIANRALTKLGAARIISFADDNKQARAISSMFEIVRDAELRSHIWSFSVKRASLAALVSTPDWGFQREFPVPSDCLRILMVNDVYNGPSLEDYRNQPVAEYSLEGNKILTNFPAPLKIRYVSRVFDTTQWDSMFVEAMACRLAMELAEDLTQSNTKRELAQSEYVAALRNAIRSNALEQPAQDLPDNSWLLGRL